MNEEIITASSLKRLVKEIDDLQKINDQHKKINGELRDAINKAIEFIENYNQKPIKSWEEVKNRLLQILQGEKNEL